MWCTCFFESKVGTLADQLNVVYFSNTSIISDSYLSNKFGIMSGTLFSLMDSGAVLSRYDDGTEYKGMSACKSRDFCHLGQSTISGGWMKILRLLTLLLPLSDSSHTEHRMGRRPDHRPPPPVFRRHPPPHPNPHPRRVFFVRRGPTTTRAPSFAPANSGEL